MGNIGVQGSDMTEGIGLDHRVAPREVARGHAPELAALSGRTDPLPAP